MQKSFFAIKKLLFVIVLFFSLNAHAFAQREVEACENFFKASDYKRAIQMGEVAIKKYPNDAYAHLCLGVAYLFTGELKLALASLMQAEKLTYDKEMLIDIYNSIGLVYDKVGYLDDALFYYFKALTLAKELERKDWEVILLDNIGGIYYYKGDYDKALKYYEESLNLEKNEKEKAKIYNNIAVIYSEKGEYEKALEYLFKALDVHERYGNYHSAAISILNIGSVYRRAKNYEKAERYLFEGLSMIRKIGDKYWEGVGLLYLGELYVDLENKQKAIEYLTSAYDLFKSIGADAYVYVSRKALLKLGVDPEKLSVEQKQERKTNENRKKKNT